MEELNRSIKLFHNIYRNRVKIDLIIENIKKELIKLLGNFGIWAAISDIEGNIKYIDKGLEKFYKYIQNFCKYSSEVLESGSYSIPLSNLIFFRISEKVIVVLSSKKAKTSRLITFVTKMDKYKAILNHIVDKIKTVNYWDTQASATILFESFQEQKYSSEINDLFNLVEQSLDKFEFDKTLKILNTIKKVYKKLDDNSVFTTYIDNIIKKLKERLLASKDLKDT
ncbi:MAG: hypothetical protein ACTSRG_05680 [Candidatus Helarchaeota archaeon]